MSDCRKLLSFAVALGLAAGPVLASEGTPPRTTPDAPAAGAEAPAEATQPAAEPLQPAIIGLAPEFAAALAADGKPSKAEQEDRAALTKFYESRQFEPVWMTTTGLGPAGQAILAEFAKADDWGLEAAEFRLPDMPAQGAELSRTDRARLDAAVSLAVLKYARHARGGRMNPSALSKFIDRSPPLAEPSLVIDEAARAATPDAYLRGLHPKHAQFELLRQKYVALKRGGQVDLAPDKAAKKSKEKDKQDADALAQRLLVNMEQWRWMPEDLGRFHVWVNIPEYLIRVVRDGKAFHTERVIVGKGDTQTPLFSDEMEQVIFHPFWGVPNSIKTNEIYPSLARGSTKMLDRNNLRLQYNGRDVDPESVDWSSTDIRRFHVYQPPGSNNVLGVVKFRFPNKHDVYMHDTPTKNLFNAPVRTFSHGCMRVRDPVKFAAILLAEDQGWPATRVAAAVDSGPKNNHVNLTQHIPVHMTYFTLWVGDNGKLERFADIYDHESKISLGIEGKTHLIARWKEDKAPPQASPIGSLAETKSGGNRKEWMRRIFEN